jgi:hypothetical protein
MGNFPESNVSPKIVAKKIIRGVLTLKGVFDVERLKNKLIFWRGHKFEEEHPTFFWDTHAKHTVCP